MAVATTETQGTGTQGSTTENKSKAGISIAVVGVIVVIIIVVVRYMNRVRPVVIAPVSVPNHRRHEEESLQKEIRTSLLDSLPVMRYNTRLLLKHQRPRHANESTWNTYSPRKQPQLAIKGEKPWTIHTEAAVLGSTNECKSEGSTSQTGGQSGSSIDPATCSVCIESFAENENVRILPCSHIYHQRCIDPWLLNKSDTCPLCRKPLQEAFSTPGFVPVLPRPARLLR
ncbi:hypothetical protein V498_01289 [Pseudogymnoascus sp. VKM F-4517 (FW-2822)]|nr:hypothetical protein V498_01289 [Pseudogymnoascus sp. VKM F-4517 (FW-2822)]